MCHNDSMMLLTQVLKDGTVHSNLSYAKKEGNDFGHLINP
jgi:hypothetical protein